jgi:hypothetical protein
MQYACAHAVCSMLVLMQCAVCLCSCSVQYADAHAVCCCAPQVNIHATLGLLHQIEMFKKLPGHILELLASRLTPDEVPPGHDIFVEGAENKCLWLLQVCVILAAICFAAICRCT